jgi:hypothetical protein
MEEVEEEGEELSAISSASHVKPITAVPEYRLGLVWASKTRSTSNVMISAAETRINSATKHELQARGTSCCFRDKRDRLDSLDPAMRYSLSMDSA